MQDTKWSAFRKFIPLHQGVETSCLHLPLCRLAVFGECQAAGAFCDQNDISQSKLGAHGVKLTWGYTGRIRMKKNLPMKTTSSSSLTFLFLLLFNGACQCQWKCMISPCSSYRSLELSMQKLLDQLRPNIKTYIKRPQLNSVPLLVWSTKSFHKSNSVEKNICSRSCRVLFEYGVKRSHGEALHSKKCPCS